MKRGRKTVVEKRATQIDLNVELFLCGPHAVELAAGLRDGYHAAGLVDPLSSKKSHRLELELRVSRGDESATYQLERVKADEAWQLEYEAAARAAKAAAEAQP